MEKSTRETAVLTTLMEKLEKQTLPRLLALKDKVDQGDRLGDRDIDFLEQAFANAYKVKPILDKHPQYQALAAQVISLYKETTSKALENENR